MSKLPMPGDRVPLLEARRTLKMARSAHAYVRGNTALFYQWLGASPAAKRLPEGPPVWICGDCHLGNLGPIADANGRVEIEIRDLDQAVIGNPVHDLIRLGLSLATAARGSDLPGVTTARMIEEMVAGYEAALADPAGDNGPEPEAVIAVRKRALGRRWRHLAKERIGDIEPSIPLGKKFWPLSEEERSAIAALFEDRRVVDMVLSLRARKGAWTVRMVDAAYWLKGCSSLGLARIAALVELRNEAGNREHALIDIKEATKAVAPAAPGVSMPRSQAARVVAAARALSPHLGNRIAAAKLGSRQVFVRELMPQDLKLEIDQFSTPQAIKAARYLAFVVGKAHARQMSSADRRTWLDTLTRHRSTNLDAPSWLWESVVVLAGLHEEGYLQHCRRYALAGS